MSLACFTFYKQACWTLDDPLKRYGRALGCVNYEAGNWAPQCYASQRMLSCVPHASSPCGVTSSCRLPTPWRPKPVLPPYPSFVSSAFLFKTVSVLIYVRFGLFPSTGAKRNEGGQTSRSIISFRFSPANMFIRFSVAGISAER